MNYKILPPLILIGLSAGLLLWFVRSPAEGVAAAPVSTPESSDVDIRSQLVAYALSLQGTPYIRGGSGSYRAGQSTEGGDCSATMQHIYAHVTGIDITESTFSQWPTLQPIDGSELLPADLWFGVFPEDEHVGMVADIDEDGKLDLIHNGADMSQVHITYDFMNSYLGVHTKGFRRALQERNE